MAFYLKVTHNLFKIPMVLNEASGPAVRKAVARSLNETRAWIYSKGSAIIRTRVNLPINGGSKGGGGLTPPGIKSLIDINRVRYRASLPLADYSLKVNSAVRSISMIHFLSPSKKRPIEQKGRAVNKRLPKTLTAKIASGRQTVLTGAFVQRSNGALQVFRRDKSGQLRKQAYRSLWDLIAKDPITKRLLSGAQEKYKTSVEHNLSFYLGKIKR